MKNIFRLLLICLCTCTKLIAQNVGIGTPTPLMRLHVSKTDSAVVLIENTQALNINVSTGLTFLTGGTYTGAIRTIGTSTGDSRMGFFTFATGNANILKERLSIRDGGDIGIGTAAPGSSFHVKRNNPNATSTYSTAQFDGTNFSSYFHLGSDEATSINGGKATSSVFINPMSTGGVYLSQSGGGVNIGGGLVPDGALLVARSGNYTAQFYGTTNSSFFNTGTAENTVINGGKAASTVSINSSSSGNIFLATGGGNVGIGTAIPTAKLDVAGQIKISGGSPGVGKVLTSDASGLAAWAAPINTSAGTGFKVFSTAGTTVANSLTGNILYNTAAFGSGDFDDGNNFNNTTNSYVAPTDGVYQFNVNVSIANGTATQVGFIDVYPSGSGSASNLAGSSLRFNVGDQFPPKINFSFLTKMDAGNTITIKAYQTVAANVNFASTSSQFSGYRVY